MKYLFYYVRNLVSILKSAHRAAILDINLQRLLEFYKRDTPVTRTLEIIPSKTGEIKYCIYVPQQVLLATTGERMLLTKDNVHTVYAEDILPVLTHYNYSNGVGYLYQSIPSLDTSTEIK